MENSPKKSSQEDNVKISYSTERVNLQDYGYTKSGSVQGDPDAFTNYLERILNGDLVDESYRGITESERKEKWEKIKDLEKTHDETVKSNSKIEQEIEKKETQIEEHRKEVLQIREKNAGDHEKLLRESFSPLKFSINLFILVMLTGYLFFFYVSAAYKALYNDFDKIASGLYEGISTNSIMPGPYELSEALKYNYLLFLIPFVFYAFGWAFHVLLELKHRAKPVFIGLLITITFVVDLLIALIIHNNIQTARELMGLSTKNWNQDATFYIILFLGFLVYIIWSILLDSLLREWKKRQITHNLKKIIQHLRKDIKVLQNKILPAEQIRGEIDKLKDEVNTYVQGNLKGYIDQFSSGWISYLAPDSMKDKKNQCMNIRNEFLERHGIQPGIVKVVKKSRKG